MMTLTSCSTTRQRVIAAAEIEGRAKAKSQIPDQPAECAKHMERVVPQTGDKAWWIQARWNLKADAIDRQIDDCSAFNRDLKAKMEAQ